MWLYWCVMKLGEKDFLLFVIIMIDLLLEILEVGYNCCLVLIKFEDLDVWFKFDLKNLEVMDYILMDNGMFYF